MQRSRWVLLLIAGIFLSIVVTACGSADSRGPEAEAIHNYLEALVAKEENNLISLSCAAWESQAKLEYDSFAAVEVAIENPDCKLSSQDGDTSLVKCTGKIIASYGAEDLILELDDRTYQVVNEGGEWRMCGYH